MKIRYAQIHLNLVVNTARFKTNAEIPEGWIDVTGVSCDIGDPLDVDGVPIRSPSYWHTVNSEHTGWVVTPENQALKDAEEAAPAEQDLKINAWLDKTISKMNSLNSPDKNRLKNMLKQIIKRTFEDDDE